MTTACTVSTLVKYEKPPETINYKFGTGPVFTDELEGFSADVTEILKEQGQKIKALVVDISEADDFSIKHRRFFGACNDLERQVRGKHKGIRFQLIVNDRQKEIFGEFMEALSVDAVVGRVYAPVVLEKTRRESAHMIRLKYFAFPICLIAVCFLVFIGSLLFIRNIPLKFVLGISSGILLYEGYLLIRIYDESGDKACICRNRDFQEKDN
jgi:hypothetical protein